MNRMFFALAAMCLTAIVAGCSTEESPPVTQATNANSAAVSARPPQQANPIAQTVFEFLDAIRTGDTQTSSSRLTPLALKKINENDMIFAPPASENARFKLGQVEMFAEDKASVDSEWIDLDADGKETKEFMTWALKHENGLWRISGMIAHMGPSQSPVVINFEEPSQLMGGGPKQKRTPTTQPAAGQQPPMATSPRHATQPAQPTQDPFRR